MAVKKPINLKNSGRKGGTRFPNYSLKQVIPNLKELISKTHSKSINLEQLNAGVFKWRSKSTEGAVKYSSLKQYGLADGEYSSIQAKELASHIELSLADDKIIYIRQAFLNVPSFKNAFETFQSSTVSKTKIKSYCVSTLKVHPDLADKFLKSFLESGEVANIYSANGEEITFISEKEINKKSENRTDNEDDSDYDEDVEEQEDEEVEDSDDEIEDGAGIDSQEKIKRKPSTQIKPNITFQIDSTLDPDKLGKQLKLLKKYGLI